MNLSKLSKKSPHADNRQTLAALHQDKLKEFENEYRKLPTKEEKLKQLIQRYKIKDSNNLQELYEEICKLQKEVKRLRCKEDEYSYLIDASSFIKKYYTSKTKPQNAEPKNPPPSIKPDDDTNADYQYIPISNNSIEKFINKKDGMKKGKICKDYINQCLMNFNCKGHSEYMKEEITKLICKRCNILRTVIQNEAVASCESCGHQIPYQDIFQHQEHREEVEVLSPFAYKRINHFVLMIAF